MAGPSGRGIEGPVAPGRYRECRRDLPPPPQLQVRRRRLPLVGSEPAARSSRGAARNRHDPAPAERAGRGDLPGPAGARPRPVLAVDPHEERDRRAAQGAGDEGRRLRDADRQQPEPDERAEAEAPEDGDEAVGERWRPQMHGQEYRTGYALTRASPLRSERTLVSNRCRGETSSWTEMVPGRFRCGHRNRLIGTKDSPTRFRFRPPLPVTFALRLRPPPAASSYSRPVVGARGNLGACKGARKGRRTRIDAICGKSKCPHLHTFYD